MLNKLMAFHAKWEFVQCQTRCSDGGISMRHGGICFQTMPFVHSIKPKENLMTVAVKAGRSEFHSMDIFL